MHSFGRICSFFGILGLLAILITNPGQAQTTDNKQAPKSPKPIFLAGQDYDVVSTPARHIENNDGKIEVVSFFWYGCPTCRHIDMTVNQWLESLPDDVRVEKLPAIFTNTPAWGLHGKLFYVLEQLGLEKKLHTELFDTVQRRGPSDNSGGHPEPALLTYEEQLEFAENHGIKKEAFEAAFNSKEVQARMDSDQKFLNNADLAGVPGMIINGRYAFTITPAGVENYIQLAESLIELERKKQAK